MWHTLRKQVISNLPALIVMGSSINSATILLGKNFTIFFVRHRLLILNTIGAYCLVYLRRREKWLVRKKDRWIFSRTDATHIHAKKKFPSRQDIAVRNNVITRWNLLWSCAWQQYHLGEFLRIGRYIKISCRRIFQDSFQSTRWR